MLFLLLNLLLIIVTYQLFLHALASFLVFIKQAKVCEQRTYIFTEFDFLDGLKYLIWLKLCCSSRFKYFIIFYAVSCNYE